MLLSKKIFLNPPIPSVSNLYMRQKLSYGIISMKSDLNHAAKPITSSNEKTSDFFAVLNSLNDSISFLMEGIFKDMKSRFAGKNLSYLWLCD